ncbi:MAG: hypothetical protein WBB69_03030 [Anaerolineales bacterium]
MLSAPVICTAIISAFGLLLNCGMLYVVLSRAKQAYHYLFSAVLFICAVWDIGILLCMVRNTHENELIIYGYLVFLPCIFLTAVIYQFSATYLNRLRKYVAIGLWVLVILGFLGLISGLAGKIVGVFNYSWGNIFRLDKTLQNITLFSIPIGIIVSTFSSWMFLKDSKRETSPITRRHMIYMAISFGALTLANIKLAVLYNVDKAFLLPAGMFVNDVFSALIAIAIVKHHLFDITLIIKKSALYSLLAGIVIFVFSFSEHILVTYLGEWLGGHSQIIHFISIGIGIMVLMPVKHRLESRVEKFFAEKKLEF